MPYQNRKGSKTDVEILLIDPAANKIAAANDIESLLFENYSLIRDLAAISKGPKDDHYCVLEIMVRTSSGGGPLDLKFPDTKIAFRSQKSRQTLIINTEVLCNELFSSRLRLSGIRCDEPGVIDEAKCLTMDDQTVDFAVPAGGLINIIKPIENPKVVTIYFKMQGKRAPFRFSLLIDDLKDQESDFYYRCDPQVGNDPPVEENEEDPAMKEGAAAE